MIGGIFTQLGEGGGKSSSNHGEGSTLFSPINTEEGSQILIILERHYHSSQAMLVENSNKIPLERVHNITLPVPQVRQILGRQTPL